MISLLLDSANTYLVVGLAKDDKVIDKIVYEAWQKQSELMIPELDKILKRNNINPKSVGEIIVTKGPGSYTGVRIALTIAKIYAYTLNIPCYLLSSLMVLGKKDVPSICLINARSNRSYFAVYKNDECIIEDKILKNDEVMNYINEHKDYAVCGITNYLAEVNGEQNDLVENMLRLKTEKDLATNTLAIKAVYLKD